VTKDLNNILFLCFITSFLWVVFLVGLAFEVEAFVNIVPKVPSVREDLLLAAHLSYLHWQKASTCLVEMTCY
jgi:hypothetical protein